jgi:hypothetical protein
MGCFLSVGMLHTGLSMPYAGVKGNFPRSGFPMRRTLVYAVADCAGKGLHEKNAGKTAAAES